MTTDEVLDALGVSGETGKTICPSHLDDKPSLSVTRTDEDRILVKCHAGCDQTSVLRGLEAEYGISSRDLGGGPPVRRVVARYVYRDENGQPLFTKVRFEPKEFVIEPAGADTKAALYNLPAIRSAPAIKTVLWVEGEKSADRLNAEGFLATTLGGASKAPDKAVRQLRGRRVVILPDNDEAGRKHAETVARCLKAAGVQSVRILALPGLPVKGDVCDWLDAGHTPENLGSLVRRALGHASAASVAVRSPEWMWQPRIPAQGLTIIFGEAGLGKSTLVIDLVARWTRGDPMPESAVIGYKPINVAMYGFEDDVATVVVPRLMAAGANLERVFFLEPDPTKPILPDQVPYLRQLCDEVDAKVMILDNIENGMGAVDSHNSRSLRSALNPLSEFGLPVIAIHHPKKGGVNSSPKEAMAGSQAYTSIARSTFMVIPTGERPEDEIAFAAVKSNLANLSTVRTLYYRIGTREVDEIGETPYIQWVGGDHASAIELQIAARARMQEAQAQAAQGVTNLPLTENEIHATKAAGVGEKGATSLLSSRGILKGGAAPEAPPAPSVTNGGTEFNSLDSHASGSQSRELPPVTGADGVLPFVHPHKVDPWVAKVRAKLIAQGAIPGDRATEGCESDSDFTGLDK